MLCRGVLQTPLSNHQIIKSSNHQIIKSSNHQIIKSLSVVPTVPTALTAPTVPTAPTTLTALTAPITLTAPTTPTTLSAPITLTFLDCPLQGLIAKSSHHHIAKLSINLTPSAYTTIKARYSLSASFVVICCKV